jgi:hypothetical protein
MLNDGDCGFGTAEAKRGWSCDGDSRTVLVRLCPTFGERALRKKRPMVLRFWIAAMSEALAAARGRGLRAGKIRQLLENSHAAAGLSDTAAVRPQATPAPPFCFLCKAAETAGGSGSVLKRSKEGFFAPWFRLFSLIPACPAYFRLAVAGGLKRNGQLTTAYASASKRGKAPEDWRSPRRCRARVTPHPLKTSTIGYHHEKSQS